MGKSKGCMKTFTDFFKDKARMYRYAAMIVICILGLGGFVCFDSVGALQGLFMEFLQLSASDFSLTYSINSWPNIVICFFGGFLIDRLFGIQLGAIIYAVIMCIGHMLFSLGTVLGLFWLVLLGRFVFGIGLEVMFICLQCYTIVWFKGKELSMVICLMISISRLGTSIMYEIANPLYNAIKDNMQGKEAVGTVYFIVGIMTFISIGCGIVLRTMDPKKYEKQSDEETPTEGGGNDDKKIKFKDILSFPGTFWIIIVTYCVFISAIFVIIPFSQGFFMATFNLSVESANSITSFFSILSAVIAPFLGIIVDKMGRTVFFLEGGMISVSLAHALLAFSSVTPYVGMFFMAVGCSFLVGALSPMLSFIFPEHQLGTAFGVNMAFVNVAYSCNLLIAGALVDNYGFQPLEIYLLSWSLLGMIASAFLWIQDKRTTGVLNMTPAQRLQFEDEAKKKDEAKLPLKG